MKTYVLDDYERLAESATDWSGLDATFIHEHLSVSQLAATLTDATAIIIMRERTAITDELLAQLPELRLIVTTGTRNAAIDIRSCSARGITVCGTESGPLSAAELTWGLLLCAARGIPDAVESLREGDWFNRRAGIDLEGLTLGVVGLGRLGGRVAKFGRAFGMTILAWSPNLTVDRAAAAGAQLATKDELFSQSDFVTLHLVLSEETRGIVGAREFELMKPAAWLINTSRAGLVDNAEMAAACRNSSIGGAAIDVFNCEPPGEDDELLRLSNVIATPHIGYSTAGTLQTWYVEAVECLRAFQEGSIVRELT